jgi:cytochrome c peroxidase
MAAAFRTAAWGPAGPEESWLAGLGAVMAAHLVATGRTITLTARYFHDGSAKTTEQAWSLAPLVTIAPCAGGRLGSEPRS